MNPLIDNDPVQQQIGGDQPPSPVGHGLLRMGALLICPGLPGQQAEIGSRLAGSFNTLDPSAWLVARADMRLRMQAGQFTMMAEHVLEHGVVHTTPNLSAVALWLPAPAGELAPLAADYDERLREICGDVDHYERFRRLDEAMEGAHHQVAGPHWYLPFLGVAPQHQRTGLGSALLLHQHRILDRDNMSAFLIAADTRSRGLYLTHGYRDHGAPIQAAADAPWMYPMLREPNTPLDSFRDGADAINDATQLTAAQP